MGYFVPFVIGIDEEGVVVVVGVVNADVPGADAVFFCLWKFMPRSRRW